KTHFDVFFLEGSKNSFFSGLYQFLMISKNCRLLAIPRIIPKQPGAEESVFGLRVRDVSLPLKSFKFVFSSFPYGFNEFGITVIHKILERLFFPIFLPHK